jgi:hypothetical protein
VAYNRIYREGEEEMKRKEDHESNIKITTLEKREREKKRNSPQEEEKFTAARKRKRKASFIDQRDE